MSVVDEIISKVRGLPVEDQVRIARELNRDLLIRKLREIEAAPAEPLPISDEELNQIVHEARREVLRARNP